MRLFAAWSKSASITYSAAVRPSRGRSSVLQPMVDKLKAGGVTLGNLMIGGFPNTIYGRPGRDEEIEKVRQSIQAAGQVGIPVVEYNFYAHRAMEGYYEEVGRGGAGLTGVDYDRMQGLSPEPEEGAHNLDEMWANITYFLKAVVPVAEKANVRLALHPNDPPVSDKSRLAADHGYSRWMEAPDRNRG